MLNELEEFKAYTTPVKYEVSRKGDTTFLGRFTFDSLLNFEDRKTHRFRCVFCCNVKPRVRRVVR